MEPFRTDSKKLAEMIMGGDHPSFTSKAELNARDTSDVDKDRRHTPSVYGKVTPTASRAAALPCGSEHELKVSRAQPTRTQQAHVLRAATLRSTRWAPYQLVGWALLLLAAHALAGLAELLERALPPLRSTCEYVSDMARACWRSAARQQLYLSALLGVAAGALWAAYGALRTARALALWALLPVADGPQDADSHHLDLNLRTSLE